MPCLHKIHHLKQAAGRLIEALAVKPFRFGVLTFLMIKDSKKGSQIKLLLTLGIK